MTKKTLTKPTSAVYSGKAAKKPINQAGNMKKNITISKPVDGKWKKIAEKVVDENIGAWKTLAKE
jgi:hypothetical protein